MAKEINAFSHANKCEKAENRMTEEAGIHGPSACKFAESQSV